MNHSKRIAAIRRQVRTGAYPDRDPRRMSVVAHRLLPDGIYFPNEWFGDDQFDNDETPITAWTVLGAIVCGASAAALVGGLVRLAMWMTA
jgi:hypothetical protein